MRVCIDQDLCTGDGLCTDHCFDVFVLLEDGLSYVRDSTGDARNDPGGRASIVAVLAPLVDQTIAAALDCPGECIFLEDDQPGDAVETVGADAELVERGGS